MKRLAKWVLWIFGVLLGVVILYLTFVTFAPGFSIRPPVLEPSERKPPHLESEPPANRRDVTFEVGGRTLSAGIAAVIAQVPGLAGEAAAEAALQRNGVGLSLRMFMHGQRDMVRKRLGLEPHRIPLVGHPGTVAMMNTPEAYDFFATVADDRFVNEACARLILRGGLYRPLDQLEQVRSPILIQVAEYEALAPPIFAAAIGDVAQVVSYPIGHFDIYFGDHFDKAVRDQLAFLDRHVRDRRAAPDDQSAQALP